jgi:hypothetical protein
MVSAGSDATGATAASESAQPSGAHAASRESDAAPAKPQAEDAARTPENQLGAEGRATSVENPYPEESVEQRDQKPSQEVPERLHPVKRKRLQERGAAASGPGGTLLDACAEIEGGEVLPEDGIGFVEKLNESLDLVSFTEQLLRRSDEKCSKNLLAQLLALRYGKNARLAAKTENDSDDLTWNLP